MRRPILGVLICLLPWAHGCAADPPATQPYAVVIDVPYMASPGLPVVTVTDAGQKKVVPVVDLKNKVHPLFKWLKDQRKEHPDLRVLIHGEGKVFYWTLEPVLVTLAEADYHEVSFGVDGDKPVPYEIPITRDASVTSAPTTEPLADGWPAKSIGVRLDVKDGRTIVRVGRLAPCEVKELSGLLVEGGVPTTRPEAACVIYPSHVIPYRDLVTVYCICRDANIWPIGFHVAHENEP